MKNMFGDELSGPESRLVDCYRMLHMTVDMHGDDLPRRPCESQHGSRIDESNAMKQSGLAIKQFHY